MMRQFPKPKLPLGQTVTRGRASSTGAALAAAAGAAGLGLTWSTGAVAEDVLINGAEGAPSLPYPEASLAPEAELIATFGAAAPLVPVPADSVLPPATALAPASGSLDAVQAATLVPAATGSAQSLPVIPLTAGSVPAGALPAVPFPAMPVMTTPAVALVGNVAEVAQARAPITAAAPAQSDGSSFWPEGHWESDAETGGGWGGLVITGASLGGAAFLVGAGYLFWRSINSEPDFEHAIVYESFDERPCGEPVYVPPKYAVTYEYDAEGVLKNPPKDTDGDTLTFSLVESATDDSSLLTINPATGQVSFINDPQMLSPGDLNRDGVYHFTIKVEDEDGYSDTQVVNLTMQASPFAAINQETDFMMNGGSVCADIINITETGGGQYAEEISTGLGNDWVGVSDSGRVVGIELGAGEDTLAITAGTPTSVTADLGTGRDIIDIDAPVKSLTLFNFGEDDLIDLTGRGFTAAKVNTASGVILYKSEVEALGSGLGTDEIVAYQNGEDTYIVTGLLTLTTSDPLDIVSHSGSTIKLEDVILSDYSQILI